MQRRLNRPHLLANFTFDEKGVTFRLPQGELTAEALECPSALVSYQQLRSSIGPGSPVKELACATPIKKKALPAKHAP